ncbi:type I-E CRISPR-associated protein Cas5/CasD [Aureimonas altamirensis]|uniref:type I-E CRISPR-associated protein Cas5/CasD n=1 Tax=Aureimonas altamirensis TaxID=370622 RepID=UPI002036D9FB|nr:type I-E CRISPR-associated protein Cas5/CasD [Aureimonas altamirensis]MCM2502577.1 type I-E CRISPR-associated protein Cas5/CasD [Aureimonas altamirensis]
MAEHLVFTLCGALGAMGDLAGYERRGTLTWPGRSAVIGLVAAALGIRRGDDAGYARLDMLRMAVGVIDDGVPLRDYHTVETVPTAAARRPDSRPLALKKAGRGTNTIITLRDYRVGIAYAVAVWAEPGWAGSLHRLAEALRRPVFTLYLGRKSCPLAAPPAPIVVDTVDAISALNAAQRPPFGHEGPLRLIASDVPLGPDDGQDSRNDRPVDRAKWHFADRRVYMHRPSVQEAK